MNFQMQKLFLAFTAILLVVSFNNCSQFNGGGQNNQFSVQSDDGSSSLAKTINSYAKPLTPREYNGYINSVFKLNSNPSLLKLPVNTVEVFNFRNDSEEEASTNINVFVLTSEEVIKDILEKKDILDEQLNCTAKNRSCLKNYLNKIAPLLFRRLVSDEEITPVIDLAMTHVAQKDFYTGVETVLRYALVHPSFLFRWEIGLPSDDPNYNQLTNQELLTRISFLIIGEGPNIEWIESMPEEPYTEDQISEIVDDMLSDPRARSTTDAFHAMWLGYQGVGNTNYEKLMRRETKGLLDEVIFNNEEPWVEIFLKDQTYVDKSLADQYEIPHNGSNGFQWVKYSNPLRKGILSHGTFLSGGQFTETNLTQRGYAIRKSLFCGEIGDIPDDVTIDVDNGFISDDPNDCKIDVIKKTALNKSNTCYACHGQMDSIALGIENFDSFGVFRDHETDRPECTIDGVGDFAGIGTFRGPAALADMGLETGIIQKCLVRRVVEFGMGRRIFNHDVSKFQGLLSELEDDFTSHQSYKELIKSLAMSPEFRKKNNRE